MISVTVVGDKEVITRFKAMPERVGQALRRAVTALALQLEGLVKQKLTGQVLNVRTGALRRSIAHRVDAQRDRVVGHVFSSGDVRYAAIHEFGGKTPAHDIVPNKAQVLAFVIGGRQIFARVVHHPGSVMPERSYLRSSLADMRHDIEERLAGAVREEVGH